MDEVMDPINVLVTLHRGYGLGDAVQMGPVLRHVARARPHWIIDYQAEEGKHQVGRGIVANTFAHGKRYPSEHYDAEVQVVLYDTWAGWTDRPNTRVSSCLHERFGLGWDPALMRYSVHVDPDSVSGAYTLLYEGVGKATVRPNRTVAVHYEGDSAVNKKNLSHGTASDICELIDKMGRRPAILDWRARSPLPFFKMRTPAAWGGSAEMVCAVVSQCEAFIGIDSGPSKCASATSTPSLVVWTGHHPAAYHDPAPNTTHLVPDNYHSMHPVCGDEEVAAFFERWYNVRTYDRDSSPVPIIKAWLEEVLS